MGNKYAGVCLAIGISTGTACLHAQEDFTDLQSLALAALGADSQRLEFRAQGWEACLGQPWNISEGWARWSLRDYTRVMDYSSGASLQRATRQAGMDQDRIGGCGAQPGAAPAAQQSSITANSDWPGALVMWMTPHGILQLAARYAPQVETRNEGGWTIHFTYPEQGVNYPVTGEFDTAGRLLRTETRIDNTVFGDMLVETRFGPYQDFGPIRYPGSIEQLQGGFAVLDLQILEVVPDTQAEAELPARPGPAPGGGGGATQVSTPAITELTPDIVVSNGAYQAVFVNQPEGIVVIDGLQSEERSAELITQAKAAFPGKAIRYVISTHNHFDHASGLRAFVAEGATIITHVINEAFFREALSAPRTLMFADPQSRPVMVQGVGDYFALGSGEQQIELYRLEGNIHADDMLIAYLPAISTVVEADILQPWINPVFGGGRDGPHPFLVHLADELDRLNLPYTQFVPIHRPPQPPLMTREDLMSAVGR
jgi:glyoxylase-like metal-dependent hydrolase (beta-lactamase superfamily II)